MHIVPVFLLAVLLFPAMARGQGVSVHAAAGPTVLDLGHSVAAGIGLAPTSRVMLMVNLDRSHLVSRRKEYPEGGVSLFRGGTITLASAELRLSLFARDRITPYAIVGMGAGRSRPNVNESFPTPVVNDVRAPFAGGGLQIPLGPRAAIFADFRLALVIGTEADDLYALAPLRAGMSWQF